MSANLGPLPTMHPREKVVTEAENEISAAIHEAFKKHNLTTGEILRVVNSCLSREISMIAKYAIRHERHGEQDKPGGLA